MNRPETMKLPPGYTCAECRFFGWCVQFFECNPSNTTCDWDPSRFQPGEELYDPEWHETGEAGA